MTPAVAQIVELFEHVGSQRYDEELSQRLHAEQTAAAAMAEGASDELIVAALLHDIGHLIELDRVGGPGPPQEARDLRHEAVGARLLAPAFGTAVTAPIALHVAAKRYLVTTDPGYAATLSEGSTASLARQGGPMSAEECRRFEALPAHGDAVRLRRWDDAAKDPARRVPSFTDHADLLDRMVEHRGAALAG